MIVTEAAYLGITAERRQCLALESWAGLCFLGTRALSFPEPASGRFQSSQGDFFRLFEWSQDMGWTCGMEACKQRLAVHGKQNKQTPQPLKKESEHSFYTTVKAE